MARIDLNSDLGESFGPYRMGDDEALLQVVTSANIACGFHAGDPLVMDRTVAHAMAAGVGLGAHPGFQDLQGFGRRALPVDNFLELEKMVVYQLGALAAIAAARGGRLTHVKFHGGLAHLGFVDPQTAQTLVRAVKSLDPGLVFLAVPHTESERAAERAGLAVAREIFADRAYEDDAALRSRKLPGAVIHSPQEAAARVLQMVQESAIVCASGKRIPTRIDSVCVHGDTPGAVAVAQAVRSALEGAGLELAPMHRTLGAAT